MSSPNATAKEALAAPSALAAQEQTTTISSADGAPLLEEDGELEADDDDRDSAIGTDSSDTTSITSSIFKGIVEHGRKYQALREGEYWGPSDEKQLESMEAAHIVYTLLEANQKNPFFLSPLPETAQNVLDLGTGTGEWARQVADMFPSVFVQGVDLAPPPNPYVPPNCKFEVDDVLKPWLFQQRFDLIHMRDMIGAFSDEQWRLVYKQAYANTLPGGWIEHLETDFRYLSNNGGNKPGSICAQWNDIAFRAFTRMGKNVDTISTCRAAMEAAGYTNIQEKWYKAPVGDWVKNPLLKEIGMYKKRQVMEGLEGYLTFVLTRFGEPEPWSPEEAQAFLAKVKNELNDPKLHLYVLKRRVWGMKPLS